MNILLNDGTFAMGVSVDEYEQLKQRGLVGKSIVTTKGNDLLMDTHSTGNVCWKCGKALTFENASDVVYLSNPPKFTCKDCENGK